MSMIRICKDKENPYVMLNKEFLNDAKLSAKSKGILAYLLSLPDDWQIYEIELVKHFKDGRDGIRSGISELIKNGYITRERIRDENGRWGAYNYCVYESSNHIGKSNIGKTNIGESDTTNNKLTDNDLTNNKDNGAFESTVNFSSLCPIILNRYYATYYKVLNKEHTKLKDSQVNNIYTTITKIQGELDLTVSNWQAMMDKHFITNYGKKIDYNANHFFTEGILNNRFFEECY